MKILASNTEYVDFCSYSDKYKNMRRTKGRCVRRWDIKNFRSIFERQRSSFNTIDRKR